MRLLAESNCTLFAAQYAETLYKTCGLSVIITDSEHIIFSAIQSETIANRLDNETDDEEEPE